MFAIELSVADQKSGPQRRSSFLTTIVTVEHYPHTANIVDVSEEAGAILKA